MTAWESSWTPSGTGSIAPPSFGTVRRGYDPAQVLEYVKRLTEHLLGLESEVRRLQGELGQRGGPAEQTPSSQDPYENVGARVADLVRTFDQDVERLRRDTESEASRVIAEAKAEAERIGEEAQRMRRDVEVEVDLILTEARTQADRIRLESQGKAEEARIQAAEALRDAQKEADKVLLGLASRRESLLGDLKTIRDRMLSTAGDLEATIQGAVPSDGVVIVEPAEADSQA
jgi:cell division septum initiation protein DivIVA